MTTPPKVEAMRFGPHVAWREQTEAINKLLRRIHRWPTVHGVEHLEVTLCRRSLNP